VRSQDYTATITVDKSPEAALKAIQNLRCWWSEDIEGDTANVGDECTHRYKDVHRCTLKLIERVPNRKVVWRILDNHFSFTKDKSEWKGTSLVFEVSTEGDKTKVHFTHRGLVPAYECFDMCSSAWDTLINVSLKALIATGKGRPDATEE
jgi:hypothetical protein